MKVVVKFGGSSLASAEQFRKVAEIIHADPDRRFVVPSAPGKCFDGDYLSQSFVKEKVERAICEISRFSGGFERVFPIKSNVDYYKKFFSNVSQENLLLWERLKNIEEEI